MTDRDQIQEQAATIRQLLRDRDRDKQLLEQAKRERAFYRNELDAALGAKAQAERERNYWREKACGAFSEAEAANVAALQAEQENESLIRERDEARQEAITEHGNSDRMQANWHEAERKLQVQFDSYERALQQMEAQLTASRPRSVGACDE